MSERGEPAFPQSRVWNAERAEYEDTQQWPGMALRDWFAGQALAGLGTWVPNEIGGRIELTFAEARERKAEWAYQQADAMLAARTNTNEG